MGLSSDQLGLDGFDKTSEKQVVLDVGLISYPCNPAGSIRYYRGPHLDRLFKLWGGLLYIRDDEDDSTGGGLGIYQYNDPDFKLSKSDSEKHETFGNIFDFNLDDVSQVSTVPYESNTLVLYPIGPRAVHGVLERSRSSFN